MSISIEKVLELIAQRPKIRTVEIADLVDCEPWQVQPLLQPMIDAGNITLHPVIAPNGKPANAFEFSDAGHLTNDYKALARKLWPGVDIDHGGRAAPAIDCTLPAPVVTRVERAIAFIAAHGRATSDQLRTVMGLGIKEYASGYLTGAIRNGRLARNAGDWVLGAGPGVRPAAAAPLAVVKTPASIPVAPPVVLEVVAAPASIAVPDPIAAAPVPVVAPVPVAAPAPAPAPVAVAEPAPVARPAFRCAAWSDGTFEIERNGITLAVLSADEMATLEEFI